ncbi:MAG: hypothetical protein COU33_04760 [Candidatus Magasanikbacteria bacterium CG10_big_fil_rev_8_21_14_0_10_43_6]|uniref:Uncharacterized protein n=1 Tax=Candidatus Magasanikbacteria bacterium CG10_big_fil_rev_8_21_14_0_10_43_6 TaxID=1974650 RepID=A0A2M6W025_9BACT|nr:MAG: hypothetical protein COU33_04760 [Candidatus Magasanikbacteria bacterium CG10_big_fil_rev_8_21_14_0_10_43_6]
MQTFFRRFTILTCVLLTLFLVGDPTFAQEEPKGPSSAPIGRYCPATISIQGIPNDTFEFIVAEQAAGRMNDRKAAEYIARQNKFCGLEYLPTGAGEKTLNIIYPFDVNIDPIDIYRKMLAINKSSAQELVQKGQARAAFFENGFLNELAQDGSTYKCWPFPQDAFIEYLDVINADTLNIQKIGASNTRVSTESCPEFDNNFAEPNAATYMIRISVKTGPLAYEGDLLGGNGVGTGNLSGLASQLNLLKVNSVPELIGALLKIFMGVLGTVSLVIIIYGGILWMTAAGNANREQEGLEIVFWAALGIIIILSSYALVKFIIGNAF